jgi:hypothetical protein
MNRYRWMWLLSVFLLAVGLTADEPARAKNRWSGLQFYEENDTFAFRNQSDRAYTQGLRLATTLNPQFNPDWLSNLSNLLCHCSYPFEPVLHVGIGQSIYTPAKITVAGPQPFDRPWAGWLYATAILHLTETGDEPTTESAAEQSLRTKQQMFEVDLGVVGQGAGARRAQSVVHEIINSPKPLGWHNQIRNQPGFNFIYSRNQRRGTSRRDIVWTAGGDLGNVMTYATVGALGRFGYNISGFGTAPLNSTAIGQKTRKNLELYVFAGADGRAVLQNVFIRGGNSRIEQKPLVVDVRTGLSARYRSVRFTYNYVRRSREFTSPVSFPGRHDFGSFAIAWEPALHVH